MKVNVKEDDCDHMPRISGIAVLPDGHVVISDYINDTVNLLDNSWTLKERLQVDAFPSDIAVVDAKTVIVSSMSHIQFVNVLPHLTAGRKVKPLKRSRGVVVFGDEIFVLCHLNLDLGEVKGFGLNLKIKRRLGFNKEDNTYLFKDPCKIAINSSGERLFVSDDRSVTCMTSSDGHVVFKYDELKCTIGLNCDAGDNILVCDLNNIEVINPDGRKRCTLLSEREFSEDLEDTVSSSPYQPCSIAHKNSDKTLIIGCYNCENIYLFKITQ